MSALPQSSTSAPTSLRLIVIDSALAQDASLMDQLPEGATVLVLDPTRGALEQLAEAAAAQPHAFQTVDILSHGGEGFLSLGGLQLDATTLSAHADELALLGQWLAPGADLLLYGCSVAEGGRGQAFIEALAQATSTDVAASTDPTGATQLGGDSVLERWAGTGSMDALPLDLSGWTGLLAVAPGLKDVLWNHTTSNFVTGFSLATSMPLGTQGASTDPGIYLGGNGNGWFEVSANGTDVGGFDLTGLALDKFAPTGQFTITVIGTKLGSGDTVSATITSAANSSAFVYPSFSAFTGLLKFQINITGTQNAAFITFDSFSIANVVDPGAAGNQAPSLTATASNPVFNEGATFAADLFSNVAASATEGAQSIDRITLTVSGLANGAAEILRVDGTNISLLNGTTTTTAGLGLSTSVSVSGSTATITLSKTGGITSAQASAVIDGLGYNNTANISADSTRVVTLTGLRDTGGTAGGGIDAKTFNIASTVNLKAATGNATDELVDVLWNHSPSNFATGFSLATSAALGTSANTDPGIYLSGNGNSGWFEVSANGTDVGGFDLTALALDKFAPAGQFTITVIGTKLGSGDTVSATITTAANSSTFAYPSFSAFTGLLKFRIEISGNQTAAAYITFDSFRIDNVVAPGALGNQAPALSATASNPLFNEGATLAADLFSNVSASATESTQNIDRITLTVSGLANGAAEILRVDGKNISLVNGATTTTPGLGMGASVSVSGSTATVTLSKTGGITSAEASTLIDGLGYRNAADISADSTRVVTLTGLRDTGGTANSGVDAKTFNIGSTVNLKAATGNATDELVDVLWNHSPSNFATGFSLAASSTLGNTTNADIGIYLNTGSTGWFEVSADAVDVGRFDLTGLLLDKYSGGVNEQYTLSITGTKLGGGSVGPVTITTAAGSSTFSTADFSAFTGLVKFRIDITSSTGGNVYDITFDGFRVANVQEPNAAPVLDGLQGDVLNFVEDASPGLLDAGSNATVTDTNSIDFAGGNVTAAFTAGAAAGDVLSVRNEGTGAGQIGLAGGNVSYQGTGIGTVAGGTGGSPLVVSLNASATPAAVQALLRNLSYVNSDNADPSAATRTVSISVNDGDGGTSAAALVTVNVTAINDAPVVTATPRSPSFTEDGAPVALFSGSSVSAVEAGQGIRAATFTVTGLKDGTHEKLVVDGTQITLTAGASGTTANGVGYSVSALAAESVTVSLTSASGLSNAAAQALLNGVSYANTSQAPDTSASRLITLSSVSDKGGVSNGGIDTAALSVASSVNVIAVNDAPTLTVMTDLAGAGEDASYTITYDSLRATSNLSDVDSATLSFRIETVSTGSLTKNGASVTPGVTVLGAGDSLQWSPAANANGTLAAFTVRGWDGALLSQAPVQVNVQVDAVNDTPTDILLSASTVLENSDTSAAWTVGTLNTQDVDTGQSFTYSVIGGADATAFEIGSNGLLQFKAGTVLDHEAQSSYEVIVRSVDSGLPSLHHDKAFTILVTDVNEAPVLAHPLQDQGASVTLPFHCELPADSFSDPDDGDMLSYTVALADGGPLPAWLVFDPVHRTFDGTPPLGSDGTLTIRVTASDSDALFIRDEFDLVIKAGPTVQSIVRAGSADELTNADTLSFTVTFNEAVTGVSAADFTLATTGDAAGTVASVAGSGSTYVVTVTQVAGDGSLRLDLNSAQTGIQSVATGLDILAGHAGDQAFLLDNTLPDTPAAPQLNTGSDTGASGNDGVTQDATPTLTGSAEAGSTVELFAGSTSLGSTQADALTGAWSITPTVDLDDGPHTLTVTATDAAGNVSAPSPGREIVIDTQAPATLTLSITDSAATDGITRITTVTVGNLEADARWEYSTDGGNQWLPRSNGSFELVEGSYAPNLIQARQTDIAGNTSAVYLVGTALTVDTTAPVVSMVGVPADGTYAAGAVLDFSLHFSEAIEVGGTPRLALTVGGGTVYADYFSGHGTADLVFRAIVPAGSQDVDGIAIASALELNGGSLRDVAGNDAALALNQAGSTSGVLVDGIAPVAPAITSAALTRFALPVLEGSAETGTQVSVTVGGATYRVQATDGAWRVDLAQDTPTDGVLALDANGDNPVSVFATDAAGNESDVSTQTLRIDTLVPDEPGITSAPITASAQPVIRGTAEAGSEVIVTIGGATYATTAIDGAWSVDLGSATPIQGTLTLDVNGTNDLSVTATDAAGNISAPAEQTLLIDTTVPDTPSALMLDNGSDTGFSHTDGVTQDATPTLTGQAEVDSTVTVYSGNTLLGTTQADSSGQWSFTPDAVLSDGAHGLRATATDAAGNTSAGSFILPLTIDTTAPSTPTLDRANVRTHAGLDAVVGNLSSSDTASPLVYALIPGTGSADNALFSIEGQQLVLHDPAAAGAGPRSVRVSVTDLAGNVSEQSFNITVSANTAPTLSGVPAAAQPVTVGQPAALADLQVADADGDALTVTLTPVNGQIGGLPAPGSSGGATWTEADGVLTLSGTAPAINALLADATFTATSTAAASIAIRVSDGIVSAPVMATYALTPGIVLTGTTSSELLAGSSGNDRLDGAAGTDWLAYAGPLAAHTLQATAAGEWQVRSNTEGTDTLLQVERLLFSDGALALDLQDQGHAAQAAQLITTLLGAQALENRALFGEVLAYVDTVGPAQLLQTLQELGVLSGLAGGDAPEQLAALIYTNLVGQTPNAAQLQEVLDYQTAHGLDAAGLVWAAAQLPLATERAGLAEASTTGWAFEVFGGVLFGSTQDDTLTSSVVAQHIDGREGIDTLVYAGARAQHDVHLREGGGWTVERSGPFTDQLMSVERLQFSDGALALDLDGHAGEAARLLASLAGASALEDAALVGLAVWAVDEQGLDGAARLAIESGFAARWAGGDTLEQLIANAYVRISGHAAADWELQAFVDHAQASGWDSAQTLAALARLPDTAQSIDLIGLSQQGLVYEPWIGG